MADPIDAEPAKERIHVSLRPWLLRKLEEKAKAENRSVSSQIEFYLIERLGAPGEPA